jgi:hypothetical protein
MKEFAGAVLRRHGMSNDRDLNDATRSVITTLG